MRVKATLLLSSLTVAMSFLLLCGSAYGQGTPTAIDSTHYWTYKLQEATFYPNQVSARDQFFPTYTPVYLDSLTRLVNWVVKEGSAVRDTFVHYTWWNIRNKLPFTKIVQVSNQFGDYPVTIENLEFLLVPALKNPVPPIHALQASHYLCYRAHGFPGPTRSYFLRDEWRNDIQRPFDLEYFCVPCWKEHAGVEYPPIDLETHLAVYPIAPYSDLFYPLVQDQFLQGPHFVRQTPLEYLFVPSKKTEITTTKPSTWGRLKVLYR